VNTKCPNCKTILETDDSAIGARVPCPDCNIEFVISPIPPAPPAKAPAKPGVPVKPPPIQKPPEEYTTRCPYCGRVMPVSSADEKVKATCTGCLQKFTPYRYKPPAEIKPVQLVDIKVSAGTLIGVGFALAFGMSLFAVIVAIVIAIVPLR
jgi:DNA-directed RNA polymerase subunit RPC12/RpoP